jgi:hypothetical protein
MGFMDGLGGAASTLVQRDYLASASLRGPVIASVEKQSPHCADLSLRAAFSREEQSDVAGSNPKARTAGSASPPCLHNVGYGRPAPRAFAVTQPVIALSRHWEDLSLR